MQKEIRQKQTERRKNESKMNRKKILLWSFVLFHERNKKKDMFTKYTCKQVAHV